MSLPFHLISGITLSCALLASSTTLWAKDYYKWVDANGSTHYTTTPPPKNAQKKGKVQTHGWNNSTSAVSPSNTTPVNARPNTGTPSPQPTEEIANRSANAAPSPAVPAAPPTEPASGKRTPIKNY